MPVADITNDNKPENSQRQIVENVKVSPLFSITGLLAQQQVSSCYVSFRININETYVVWIKRIYSMLMYIFRPHRGEKL